MSVSYRDAGVDIDAGEALVKRIKPLCAATRTAHVMGSVGGFAGLCKIPPGMAEPVLVSGTDGVGTKLKLAFATGVHDTVGIDLVAMCVNDLVCQGAEPLFFLDYFATGKLHVEQAATIINGIATGCELAGCALIGGETAEMPGMYANDDFDLAGFAVGAMERGGALPRDVTVGDKLIALCSSGVHSNGFSLVRHLVDGSGLTWADQSPFSEGTLGAALLAPTRLYVKQSLAALNAGGVHALTHITGGGLSENIPRALDAGQGISIDLNTWDLPPVFQWLMAQGGIEQAEMLKTFNCGLGMALIVDPTQEASVIQCLSDMGEDPVTIGQVTDNAGVHYTGTLS